MTKRMMLAVFCILSLMAACDGLTGRGEWYPGSNDLYELPVIHLNDFHARFDEISPAAGPCHSEVKDQCIGGLARVYAAVKQLKNEKPNAIFLNAGDHFQGTLWYNLHRWNVTALFMNKLPHDAMTIGNHEFDHGIAGVVPFLKNVKAPVVVTNIDASEEPTFQGLTKNSTIIIRDGRKIGVIGVILSKTNKMANTEKLRFLDEVETVNLEAEKLKTKEDVDIIVVLSHCGLDVDRIIAAKSPNVDLIVGGHSHSFLYSGVPPFIDTPEDDYPVVVTQQVTNRTVLIVQAAAYTKYLGNITVWFDKNGEIVDWEGNPILLDQGIEQDPQILEALKPWKVEVDELGKRVIGTSKVILKNDCYGGDCNLGNFITDAMIDAWMNKAENETSAWTYAAVACMNSGGLRSSIGQKVNDRITYSDLITAQPFENTWDVIELQGRHIIETLKVGGDSKSFHHWSGLRATFDFSQEPHNRLVHAEIRCRVCDIPIYEKIDPDEWYRIVVVSHLVRRSSGDEQSAFVKYHRNHEVGLVDTDYLIDYIGRMSPIIQDKEYRTIILG